MRMMLIAEMPNDSFNAAIRDGSAGAKIKKIMDAIKPEAAYFTDLNGMRTAVLIVDMASTSQIPALVEPFFLTFNATIKFHPVMLPEDLAKAGLDKIGKTWG